MSSRPTVDVPTAVLRTLSPRGKVAVAVGTYLLWALTTWTLEGRLLTLQRPEATLDRLLYTGVANVLIGTLFACWIARTFVDAGFTTRARLGLRSVRRTLLASAVGAGAGVALYVAQGPPTTDPVVTLNAFSQVLPVSIAELAVCWLLVGGSVEAALRTRVPDAVARAGALVVASALFGLYHVAHSPPFNTVETIALLTVVSLGTGAFFFVGRSAYGALVFHNFLALFGVTSALAAAGRLAAYRAPVWPLLVTGVVALLVFVGAERVGWHGGVDTP
ncbi:hypothetical protein [Haloplanus aerogenes]|uniref:CPBP family intramembrane metalloprotease n=1 Tax=Haloplanus aerogenes TaxID=660522 RepID=A0A3M0CWD6_9EURY|nr:hypothetical protein [Haloplanus aerogenes]AZH26644.1 hypothetical protein DU502_15240 [Haloplanus aerogenes]RMB12880.1 hypothetical protein ATH50_3036 [Haloplanus aerogenes]